MMQTQGKTIGILFPGELGSSLGSLLRQVGLPVVTTLSGRSLHTRGLCEAAGLCVLDTIEEVVAASDYVISLVPPGAALEVAERFCAAASGLKTPPVFVDANSISPCTVLEIEARVARAGASFLDASVHGLASRLQAEGTLFLSGGGGSALAEMLSGVLCVRYLGERVGMASLLKMLLGGFSKGLVALFLEMSAVARQAGMLEDFLPVFSRYYPGVEEVLARLLPTYPRNARRRATEMEELSRTISWLGLRPGIVSETRLLLRTLGEADAQEMVWQTLCEMTERLALGGLSGREKEPCA